MKEFLGKICYIQIEAGGRQLYYSCVKVTEISETHISFKDVGEREGLFSYRKADVVEIKFSNKIPLEADHK